MSSHHRRHIGILRNFRYYYPTWSGLLMLLLMLLAGALIAFAISYYLGEWLGEYNTLVTYSALFVPAMCYASSRSEQNEMVFSGYKLSSGHFHPVGVGLTVATVLLATLAAGFVVDALSLLMPPMPDWLRQMLDQMVMGNLMLNFLCVCVAAPFFEEWLCRGMVLRGLLCNKVSPKWAIPVSALFFALIHFNPWQALPAFLIGCLMGWVYYRTGSLWLTMAMHFVNNGAALFASRLPGMTSVSSWSEIIPVGWYVLVLLVSAGLIALCVWTVSKIRLHNDWGNLDKVRSLFR